MRYQLFGGAQDIQNRDSLELEKLNIIDFIQQPTIHSTNIYYVKLTVPGMTHGFEYKTRSSRYTVSVFIELKCLIRNIK